MFTLHSEGEARLKFNSKHLKIICNNVDNNNFIIHNIHKSWYEITHEGTQSRNNFYTVIPT